MIYPVCETSFQDELSTSFFGVSTVQRTSGGLTVQTIFFLHYFCICHLTLEHSQPIQGRFFFLFFENDHQEGRRKDVCSLRKQPKKQSRSVMLENLQTKLAVQTLRVPFYSQVKFKVVNILTKDTVPRINLNIDDDPIYSHTHTNPSHSQTSRPLSSSRSLARGLNHRWKLQSLSLGMCLWCHLSTHLGKLGDPDWGPGTSKGQFLTHCSVFFFFPYVHREKKNPPWLGLVEMLHPEYEGSDNSIHPQCHRLKNPNVVWIVFFKKRKIKRKKRALFLALWWKELIGICDRRRVVYSGHWTDPRPDHDVYR